MKIEMQSLGVFVKGKQNTPLPEKNSGQSFSDILQATQCGSAVSPKSQKSVMPNVEINKAGYVAEDSRNSNGNAKERSFLEKVCDDPRIPSEQKIFLCAAYSITMHELEESGKSVASQDPSALLDKIIQLASEFDQNSTWKTSELRNILQQLGGLSLHA